MVEPAESDVVGPTVAAKQPNTLLHEAVSNGKQRRRLRRVQTDQFFLQLQHTIPLFLNPALFLLIGPEKAFHQHLSQFPTQTPEEFPRIVILLIDRQPHAEAELGIIFKQRIRPRWPATIAVLCVRSGWQVSPVNRRAPGGVSDQQAVAEQLRQQLDVRSLSASRACP